ncbi:short chain dehydrogenase [Proteus mirabilis]|uniref:Short chain dehydrogenase n=1 Tax=Proteus mirabilis TaxID=584 RepID=A0A2X2BQA7_PROMI|nr:short chain dehydrogenase [Proteus mirabilis]
MEHAPVCEQVPSPMKMPQKLKTPKDLMPLYLYLMSDDSIEVSGQSLDAQPDRKAGPAE